MIPVSLIVFIAITAVAVVIQMAILLGLYLTVKRSTARIEVIAGDLQRRATPLLENARDILADATPKVKEITSNLAEASGTLKAQAATIGDAAVEIAARARDQVIRADEMVGKTLAKVEKTTDAVSESVLTPVRRVQGVVQAINVGLATLLNQRPQRPQGQRTPEDEGMFV